jgi:hypothetical protein
MSATETQPEAAKRCITSLPIYGLDELFVAYGFDVRLAFGLPQRPVRAYRLVQTFACHVATSFLEVVEKHGIPEGDGVFVPSPCDTLNNLADILAWKPGDERAEGAAPSFVGCLDFPEPEARGAAAFLAAEIGRVKAGFLAHYALTEDRAAEASSLSRYAAAHEAIRALYARRRQGEVTIPAGAFARFLAEEPSIAREEIPARIAALEEDATTTETPKTANAQGPSLFISGITLPAPLAEAIDDMGFTVVDDDLAQGFRRFSGPYPDPALPLEEALSGKFLELGPCSTTSRGPGTRAAYVAERVKASEPQGFVYLRYPWCEPEAFDAPPMLEAVRALGVPVTEITLNPEKPTEAATITRFEAFREQLASP